MNGDGLAEVGATGTGAPDADGEAGAGAGEPADSVVGGGVGVYTLVVVTMVGWVNGPLVTVTVSLGVAM